MMRRLFSVLSSGYYAWVSRSPSAQAAANEVLLNDICDLHEDSDGVWGAPIITDELNIKGSKCSVDKVARLMKSNGLQGIPQKRQWKKKDSTQRPSDVVGHLESDFSAKESNEKWVTGITFIRTGEGFLYLCVVKDLCSGVMVGWSMSAVKNRELVSRLCLRPCGNVQRACTRYCIHTVAVSLLAISTSSFFKGHHLTCSTSAVGSCAENTSAESFFGQMKRERVNRRYYPTR
jgi:putative transposase